jgi:mono/diheme cytochrome c family protein
MKKLVLGSLGSALFASMIVAACSPGDAATMNDAGAADGAVAPVPTATTGQAVTFHKDVEPIVQAHCQKCHTDGGIAPFSLMTYGLAKDFASSMAEETGARRMPPWGAQETSECKPRFGWKDDERLSEAEIAVIKAWSEQGAPEGDPKDAPPAKAPPPTDLVGSTSIKPAEPYTLGAATRDVFRCFVMDPGLTTTKFMTGSFFVPKNKTVVHHALAFAVPSTAKLPGDGVSYECPGGPNVANANLIAAWAPGSVPAVYPTGVALPLEAGTKVIMQIHYHPHANATPDPDQTAFQFSTTDVPPEYVVLPRLIGNFRNPVAAGIGLMPGPADPASGVDFFIPAEAKAHTETMLFTMPERLNGNPVPAKLGILGVGSHMHVVGVDQKVTIKRAAATGGEPAEECLLQEPHWDFDWQRGYQYATSLETLPTISPGDKLEVRCTFDNTMNNLKLKATLSEQGLKQTQDVRLGESTLDEMCLSSLQFVVKR